MQILAHQLDRLFSFHQWSKYQFSEIPHECEQEVNQKTTVSLPELTPDVSLPLPSLQTDHTTTYDQLFAPFVNDQPLHIKTIGPFLKHRIDSLATIEQILFCQHHPSPLSKMYFLFNELKPKFSTPFFAFYRPTVHRFELFSSCLTSQLFEVAHQMSPFSFLVLFTCDDHTMFQSFGKRAYRYLQLDIGHQIATLALSARQFGWHCEILSTIHPTFFNPFLPTNQGNQTVEQTHCIVLFKSQADDLKLHSFKSYLSTLQAERSKTNGLSSVHPSSYISNLTHTRPLQPLMPKQKKWPIMVSFDETISYHSLLRRPLHNMTFNRKTIMPFEQFKRLLVRLKSCFGHPILEAYPWDDNVHLLLFIHRVENLAPGLYIYCQNEKQMTAFRRQCGLKFKWRKVKSLPNDLYFFELQQSLVEDMACELSCDQTIASDGFFTVAMLAQFKEKFEMYGPAIYQRLFWECGMIGQLFRMEARRDGYEGIGIGSFCDDTVHKIIGLQKGTLHYQDLYHFAVGKPI